MVSLLAGLSAAFFTFGAGLVGVFLSMPRPARDEQEVALGLLVIGLLCSILGTALGVGTLVGSLI